MAPASVWRRQPALKRSLGGRDGATPITALLAPIPSPIVATADPLRRRQLIAGLGTNDIALEIVGGLAIAAYRRAPLTRGAVAPTIARWRSRCPG